MSDQTFHTPSFGDEDFDIPVINQQPHIVQATHQESQHHQVYQQQPIHEAPGIMTNDMVPMDQYQQPQSYQQTQIPQNHINDSAIYNNQTAQQGVYAPLTSPMPNHHQMLLMQQQQQQQMQSAVLGANQCGLQYGRSNEQQGTTQLNIGTQQQANHITGLGTASTQHGTASEDSDDGAPNQLLNSPEPAGEVVAKAQKLQKVQRRKKKRDPNEPQRPVSAYALFFRDTQAAIKGQNPSASFGEVSKIVASMWDALDIEHKDVYKKKTEAAKKEYLKTLAAYRASLADKPKATNEDMYQNCQNPGFQTQYENYPQSVTQNAQISHQQVQHPPQQGNGMPLLTGMPQLSPMCQVGGKASNLSGMMHNLSMSGTNLMSHGQVMLHQNNAQQPNKHMQVGQQQQYLQHSQQLIPVPNPQHLSPLLPQGQVNGKRSALLPCIRQGCTNTAVINAEWEDEYCSNECVISHCRDVFASWVLSNSSQTPAK